MAEADIKKLTAQVVSAFLSNNTVPLADVPSLIQNTYAGLVNITSPVVAPDRELQRPAVSVKKSVTPDAITCLECGEELHMLKRHIRTAHGFTVGEYLSRWSLPTDYPVVAPNYGARRSEMAKAFGLGKKRNVEAPKVTLEPEEPKRHHYPASRWSKPSE